MFRMIFTFILNAQKAYELKCNIFIMCHFFIFILNLFNKLSDAEKKTTETKNKTIHG